MIIREKNALLYIKITVVALVFGTALPVLAAAPVEQEFPLRRFSTVNGSTLAVLGEQLRVAVAGKISEQDKAAFSDIAQQLNQSSLDPTTLPQAYQEICYGSSDLLKKRIQSLVESLETAASKVPCPGAQDGKIRAHAFVMKLLSRLGVLLNNPSDIEALHHQTKRLLALINSKIEATVMPQLSVSHLRSLGWFHNSVMFDGLRSRFVLGLIDQLNDYDRLEYWSVKLIDPVWSYSLWAFSFVSETGAHLSRLYELMPRQTLLDLVQEIRATSAHTDLDKEDAPFIVDLLVEVLVDAHESNVFDVLLSDDMIDQLKDFFQSLNALLNDVEQMDSIKKLLADVVGILRSMCPNWTRLFEVTTREVSSLAT